jgi:EAL domain-containing protein (putative c-di-GMP-specific phosphodiesterase class I)/CHASE2 domain-containing sensor protein/GGDEF domain-containing protein
MAGDKPLLIQARVQHLAIAFVVALIIGVLGIVSPLNGLLWAVQSRQLQHQASGDIVFIGSDSDLADAEKTGARTQLADTIDRLTAAGAKRIFVDAAFEQRGSPDEDAILNQAARRSGRTVFVDRYVTRGGTDGLVASVPTVSAGVPRAVRKEWVDHLGFTWSSPYAVRIGTTVYPSFAAALAGVTGSPDASFFIDYSTSYSSIPSYPVRDARQLLADPPHARSFAGKTVVIGPLPRRGSAFAAIPGLPMVPDSYTGIFAAETLKHGLVPSIPWYASVLFIACILLLASFARRPTRRRALYATAVLTLPVVFVASIWIGLAAQLWEAAAFLLVFGSLRLWDNFHRRAPLIDALSGLPTFEKLERDLTRTKSADGRALVVAKIHRVDEVLASLPRARHGEYMQLIADRLSLNDESMTVYSSGGRYFAWLQAFENREQLRAHLIGLRAIFATALRIGDLAVDVGITFGADTSDEASGAKRISSALAAVDKTSEAVNSVIFANHASDEERRWNISLQARLDEAMKNDEIYLAYQPQFDLKTGKMFGAEALARWDDPVRGEIPPSYFIEQCEQVGRMQALTKKVFAEGLGAIAQSPFANLDFNLSMNDSATMLNDFEVVRMLDQAHAATQLTPSKVTIEMTETARIADLQRAGIVLSELKQLGVRLSADDFGVGAASFEPFLQLPFDELKIDRLFVSRVETDRKARKIVEHLVTLGRDLDILVLAEGVEDNETFEVLRALGCPAAQGYQLGRPMPLAAVYDLWLAGEASGRSAGAG